MAQPAFNNILNDDMVDLLKIDGKGWNIALFQDAGKISAALCENCNAVCCDGVELGCGVHDDNDIALYCHKCLQDLIKQNNNKCPINSHSNPVINPSRVLRRLVLNSTVYCINNIKYIKQQNNININKNIIQTIGNNNNDNDDNDEKEGVVSAVINNKLNKNGCKWNGKFNKLLTNHLSECCLIHNPSFIIKKLQNDNKKLFDTVNELKKLLHSVKQRNKALNIRNKTLQKGLNISNDRNQILQKQLNEQQNIINNIMILKNDQKQNDNNNNDASKIEWKLRLSMKHILQLSHRKRVKKRIKNGKSSLCFINTIITNKMCNAFDIKFQYCFKTVDVMFGYIKSFQCIKNHSHGLGIGDNKDTSMGFYCNEGKSHFQLCDKNHYFTPLSFRSKRKFKNGDFFVLSFNFIKDFVQISHNNIKADKISLNGNKAVIPGVSLWYKDVSIVISDCLFH